MRCRVQHVGFKVSVKRWIDSRLRIGRSCEDVAHCAYGRVPHAKSLAIAGRAAAVSAASECGELGSCETD